MTARRLSFLAILAVVIVVPILAWQYVSKQDLAADHPFHLSDRLSWIEIVPSENGSSVRFDTGNGEVRNYTAEEFLTALREVKGDPDEPPPLAVRRALNITSWKTGLFWVSIGLLGQVLFTGRMIVQWISSERQQRSVIPVSFWWMSLGGATMLIVYFVWRVDIVGVLGQSTGWFVYLRNLWLIYGEEKN